MYFHIYLSSKNSTFYQNTIFSNINMIYNKCISKYNRNEIDKYLEEFNWNFFFEIYIILYKFYKRLFRISFEVSF